MIEFVDAKEYRWCLVIISLILDKQRIESVTSENVTCLLHYIPNEMHLRLNLELF